MSRADQGRGQRVKPFAAVRHKQQPKKAFTLWKPRNRIDFFQFF